jgi:hypothetical protein
MGVLLRRREIRMPQQFLDHPEISTRIEQVRRKRVSERMRTDALQLSALRCRTRYDLVDTAHT